MTRSPASNTPESKWICERETTLITSPVMKIVEQKCRRSEPSHPNEKPFTFYLLRSSDWCNIIPITEDGKVVLVRQYRVGIQNHTIEVPGGVADSTDASNEAAAIREMEEETGYFPLEGAKCRKLGWTYPNPAIMDNRCYSYIIGPVSKKRDQNLDPGEMIDVIEIPISEIPQLVANGEINHALILNTFFFLALSSQAASESFSKILTNEMLQFCQK